MSKYTQGPWEGKAERSGPNSWNEGVSARIEGRGTLIASFDASYEQYPETLEEVQANVRLMAAAPELLEALILMVRTHEEPAESLLQELKEQEWLLKAKSAIAKVTGE